MGKQYYCDYCNRSFADGAENRKKHLVSLQHEKMRKAHYDMFKDAATILEENKSKNPCRQFHTAGYCVYESSCKYSHLTPADIMRLHEQAAEQSGIRKNRPDPDINAWLQTKNLKTDSSSNSDLAGVSNPVLPPMLANIPNLPPSLIPCKPYELMDFGKDAANQWG
ncbi:hypothetical protein CDAR_312391 [Caerostris darwini]|uniref:Zinc finger matrin-type protein 5 n=1 Tax=Caerostris darwini TaxID=1538125 RepID=A0AAV4QSB7_9ARAC|nr:hypothetical protein CDAR_312391 [Caerostris darwini]